MASHGLNVLTDLVENGLNPGGRRPGQRTLALFMSFNPFDIPSLPIEDPVLVFSIALAAFLLAPLLIKRARLPGIVGIVLVGAAVGPGGLGLLDHHEAIVLLGEVGLIYLLFTVGLGLNLREFLNEPESAALFGVLSFSFPFVLGAIGGYALIGLEPLAALLLAAVFASHTLLAYPIVNRLGVAKNDAVTAVFGGILFTDTAALVVLALVLGADEGDLGIGLILEVAISLVILFGLVWLVLPRLGRWFFRVFTEESYFEFLFVITAFFLAASLAELLDLAGILGAFAAGLALNRMIPTGGPLQNRIDFAGNALFIPFFLFYVGMLVQLDVIFEGFRTIAIAAFLLGAMLSTKAIAAYAVGAIMGYSSVERQVMFGLSTGQAAAALAITLLGFEAGLFDAAVLNGVVLLLLVTAIVSPWITERAGRQLAVGAEIGDIEPITFDPRILLPLTHAGEYQERLVELAMVLKGGPTDQAISVLNVVDPQGSGTVEDRIEAAHDDLDALREVTSAGEVPLDIDTRVNHNPADSIARAVIEERINLLMMGWDGRPPFPHRIFGSIIDNVLEQVEIPTIVSHMGHPINTTTAMYLLLPRGIVYHDGYFESAHLLKSLADHLGVDLHIIAVDRSPDVYQQTMDGIEPDFETDVEAIQSWTATLDRLEDELDEDDLVTVIAAKQGSVGWHRAFEDLPQRLADLPPEAFIMLYPREGEPGFDRRFLRFD